MIVLCRRLLVIAIAMILLPLGLVAHAQESLVKPGTVINMRNWQQYQQYMTPRMIDFFKGKYFWKFPPDFEMVVGPEVSYPEPKLYMENTEKYAGDVKILNLPNGGHSIGGYVAGRPFPKPSDPLKGWKILVDEWYRSVPWIWCGKHQPVWLKDRFGNVATESTWLSYRRLSHMSDYDQPLNDPNAQGIDYSEYVMVMQPEQSKYTANLTLYYD
ncbi:MAG: DUF1329 domain-containing protein, partial [Candidatus Binataceae bacterium]